MQSGKEAQCANWALRSSVYRARSNRQVWRSESGLGQITHSNRDIAHARGRRQPDCAIAERLHAKSAWYPFYGVFVRITPMERRLAQAMKRQVGFSEADEEAMRALAPHIETLVPRLVNRFYEQILADPEAAAVFTGGDLQLARQRDVLGTWVRRVLKGRFNAEHFQSTFRIGEAHVRVGLAQYYMVVGIELIWQELRAALHELGIEDLQAVESASHRLLMLELATMLESYKESYSAEVRSMERSAVEEKLTRAEHLAEIGQLAASLAHEIKNPLAGISGAMQIMREAMDSNDPHRPIAIEILGQIKRLDDTVKDLLQYARPIPPRVRPVNLDTVVKRVLSILREEPALRRVRIRCSEPSGDHAVRGDEAQLEQLLMNLILNAAHASSDDSTIDVSLWQQNGVMSLMVEDHGEGMTAETRAQAFDPFFTTKAKGTGLGLSICRRIVEAHGGLMDLDSKPRRGTKVVVKLPLTGESQGEENAS